MGLFLDISVFLICLGVITAAVIGAAWLWVEHKGSLRDRILASVMAFVVAAAGLTVAVSVLDDDNGVHSWRGGAGPDTVCEYEVRSEMVGKVIQNVTYTVCRDPEGDR